jgi:hypothetical protein
LIEAETTVNVGFVPLKQCALQLGSDLRRADLAGIFRLEWSLREAVLFAQGSRRNRFMTELWQEAGTFRVVKKSALR